MQTVRKYLKIIILSLLLVLFISTYFREFILIPTIVGLRPYVLHSDFRAFYAAGQIVIHRVSGLYNLNIQFHWQKAYVPEFYYSKDMNPFRNPPFVILFFIPFIILPLIPAYYAFMIFNVILLSIALYIIFLLLPKSNIYTKTCISLMILTYIPVVNVLFFAQTSFFLLLSLLLGRLFILREKLILAGLMLSLLLIKPQYVPIIIIFFMVKKQTKIVYGMLIGIFLLITISTIMVGVPDMVLYVHFLTGTLNKWDMFSVYPRNMFTLQSLILNIFNTNSIQAVRHIWYIGDITMITIFLFICRKNLKIKTGIFDLEWAFLIITCILTSPYTNNQDLSMLIAAAVSLIHWIRLYKPLISGTILYIFIIVGYILENVLFGSWIFSHTYIYILFLITVFFYLARLQFKYSRHTQLLQNGDIS